MYHCMYDICDEGADSKGGKSLTIRNSDDVEHQFATGRVSRLIQSRSASLCSAALSLKAAMIKIFIPPQCQKGWLVVKKKKIHRGSTPGSVALSCTFIVYSFQCNFIHICMWHMYHLDLFYHTCHVTFTLHVCDQASDCSWKLQFNWILLTVQIQHDSTKDISRDILGQFPTVSVATKPSIFKPKRDLFLTLNMWFSCA